MKKILLIVIILSYSLPQSMGMLKTKKNKSGIGVFFTTNHIYKVDESGKHILDRPEKLNLDFSINMKSNFEVLFGASPGEIKFYNSEKIQEYFRGRYGVSYNLYQKKWGVAINVMKNFWFSESSNVEFKKFVDSIDKTSLTMTFFSRTRAHAYISYTNSFNNTDQDIETSYSSESLTIGGAGQIKRYIFNLGFKMLFQDRLKVDNENASFFVGLGYEFL